MLAQRRRGTGALGQFVQFSKFCLFKMPVRLNPAAREALGRTVRGTAHKHLLVSVIALNYINDQQTT